tara:strand:- start:1470 stop:2021 length:552 start_codon:yes stop_codon:yes gene_type:complete
MSESVQENVQENAEANGNELTAQGQTTTDTSGQSDLLREVMAKKDKIRGLESQLAELQTKEEKRRQERMQQDGKKDELIAELQNQVESLSPFKERLETYEANRRQALLERLPESKQEKFKGHPIDVLEDLANEYATATPVKVDNQSPGSYGGYTSMKEWAESDPKGYKQSTRIKKGIMIGYGK